MKTLTKICQAVLLIGMILSANTAVAGSPEGCYVWTSGKLSVSVNVPGFLTLSASTPAVAELGLYNSFSDDRSMFMSVPMLGGILGLLGQDGLSSDIQGEWMPGKGAAFTADLSGIDVLKDLLAEQGMDATITRSFKGTVGNGGEQVKGSFSMGATALVPQEGMGTLKVTLKLSGSYVGERISELPCDVSDDEGDVFSLSVAPPQAAPEQAAVPTSKTNQDFYEAVATILKQIQNKVGTLH